MAREIDPRRAGFSLTVLKWGSMIGQMCANELRLRLTMARGKHLFVPVPVLQLGVTPVVYSRMDRRVG